MILDSARVWDVYSVFLLHRLPVTRKRLVFRSLFPLSRWCYTIRLYFDRPESVFYEKYRYVHQRFRLDVLFFIPLPYLSFWRCFFDETGSEQTDLRRLVFVYDNRLVYWNQRPNNNSKKVRSKKWKNLYF